MSHAIISLENLRTITNGEIILVTRILNHSNYEQNKGIMIMIIYQISDLFEVLNLNYKSKKRVC